MGAVLQQAHEAYFRGSHQRALWGYLQAAAAGMELGMSNAAWLLTQGYVRAGAAPCCPLPRAALPALREC